MSQCFLRHRIRQWDLHRLRLQALHDLHRLHPAVQCKDHVHSPQGYRSLRRQWTRQWSLSRPVLQKAPPAAGPAAFARAAADAAGQSRLAQQRGQSQEEGRVQGRSRSNQGAAKEGGENMQTMNRSMAVVIRLDLKDLTLAKMILHLRKKIILGLTPMLGPAVGQSSHWQTTGKNYQLSMKAT